MCARKKIAFVLLYVGFMGVGSSVGVEAEKKNKAINRS